MCKIKDKILLFIWQKDGITVWTKQMTRKCHFQSQGHKFNQWSWSLFMLRQQLSLVHKLLIFLSFIPLLNSIDHLFLYTAKPWTKKLMRNCFSCWNWSDFFATKQNTNLWASILIVKRKKNNQNKIREYNLDRKLKSLQ